MGGTAPYLTCILLGARQKLRVEVAKAVLLGTQHPDPNLSGGTHPRWPSSEDFPDDDGGELSLDPSRLDMDVTGPNRDGRPMRRALRRSNTAEAGSPRPADLADKRDGGGSSSSVLSGGSPGQVPPPFGYIPDMPFGISFDSLPERAQNPSSDLTDAEWLSRMDPVLTQITAESSPSIGDATLTRRSRAPKGTSIPTPPSALNETSRTPTCSVSANGSIGLLGSSHSHKIQCTPRQNEDEGSVVEDDTTRSGDFSNPLTTAISLGNVEIASLLIQSGAQIDARDQEGQTALFRAVQRGDRKMACLLMDYGADILAADARGKQMVHVGVGRNDEDMVRALLEGCRRRDEAESSNLRTASRLGQQTKTLLQQVLDARQETGLTTVHLAVSLQYIDVVKVLLEFGADVNLGHG